MQKQLKGMNQTNFQKGTLWDETNKKQCGNMWM